MRSKARERKNASYDLSGIYTHRSHSQPAAAAEEFYRTLFALEVAFREAEAADGWYTLPSDADWDDAEAAGISLGLCSLHRDAFTLALEEGSSSGGGRLSHIGVQVDAEDLARLRTVVPTLGCQIVQDGQTILVFDGPLMNFNNQNR